MQLRTLVRRSLGYYRLAHAGLFLAVLLAGAVITGALLVGDSVRLSLTRVSRQRLGTATHALHSQDRFFRAALAGELGKRLGAATVPLIAVRGTVSTPAQQWSVPAVNIYGVSEAFWHFAPNPHPQPPVVVNQALADALQATAGTELIVRLEAPSYLSRDTVMVGDRDRVQALRLQLGGIASAEQLADFSLQANQVPPLNVFIPLADLQAATDRAERANLLLLETAAETTAIAAELADSWTLADAQFELQTLDDASEFISRHIFIDDAVAAALTARFPAAQPILTYFVNAIGTEAQTTPYSFVAAVPPGSYGLPPAAAATDLVLSDWTAADLGAKVGDRISLRYYVVDSRRALQERSSDFTVAALAELGRNGLDATLMPAYPGLSDADHCRDWEAGVPIDYARIRPQDEAYWNTWRGTPKALIPLASGQRLWDNRFGTVTAMRLPATTTPAAVREALDSLTPAQLGLQLNDVAGAAHAAVAQALDFRGLFIGFSFFVIAAALLLAGLMIGLQLRERRQELGVLQALGLPGSVVKRALFLEFFIVMLPGALLGTVAGMGYTKLVLQGLSSIWQGAVGNWSLAFAWSLTSLALGPVITVALAAVVLGLVLRRARRGQAADAWAGAATGTPRVTRWLVLAAVAFVAGIAVYATSFAKQGAAAAGGFFGGGALMLAASLCAAAWVIRRRPEARHRVSATGLVWRNLSRSPGRSLSVTAMLASGIFLVISLETQRLQVSTEPDDRSSGSGGFSTIVESTLPLYDDLNSPAGRTALGLPEEMSDLRAVSLRVRDGDDASCLNLSRAQQPRVLGVDPRAFDSRHAFTFQAATGSVPADQRWQSLLTSQAEDVIPAVADAATIQYGLGLKLGDELVYETDDGRPVRLRLVGALANSIFQGALLIDEEAFVRTFPTAAGHRLFLIDGTYPRQVWDDFRTALRDDGISIVDAGQRLAAFNRVQNTYISIFQVLGGLGLILGSIGLALIVGRNVVERRRELAMMRAVGLPRRRLSGLLTWEHTLLLALGVGCGLGTAALAVAPVVLKPAAAVAWPTLIGVVALLVGTGLLCTWLAAQWALRRDLLDALRRE